MRSTQFLVRLPEAVADAVLGEAVRRSIRTSDVIAEILADALPDAVKRHLNEDLALHRNPEAQPHEEDRS
jgi:hypothetical protein